jgi:diguanylate cyclase (GGDEF)-like protein
MFALPRFRNVPIRRKLVSAFSLATAAALLLATLFFAGSTWLHERSNAQADLHALAKLVGANSAAALALNDAKSAADTLATLAEVPDIAFAAVSDRDGREFARYVKAPAAAESRTVLERLAHADVSVVEPIVLSGDTVGALTVHATLETRFARLSRELSLALLASLVSFLVAAIIAWRMQRTITEPLKSLTDCMLEVSRTHDYSLRAKLDRRDELGVLAQGFNDMLAEAEQHAAQSERQRQELEAEVARRTAALQHANEALQALSVRDPLTQLYNRRFMEETLERELARALRTGGSVGLVMLDVDHFKTYNDNYGHEAGDIVLQELGRFLLRAIRSGDVACRYGGEEFLIIMPGVSESIAVARAEELRAGVKLVAIRHDGKPLPSVTISLGVALAPRHARAPRELVHAVDLALYEAKKQGRDRVAMATGCPASLPATPSHPPRSSGRR